MNILVTGGNGQLGCSIAKIASKYNHEFIFCDIPEVDITDFVSLYNIVEENKIDTIINCAAYTAVDKAENDEETAYKINKIGASVLADVCEKKGIKLIHISTDYVFDGNSNIPLTETDECNDPIGVYGKTKREGELELFKRDIDFAIIRTAWLYSEFGNNFAKTMIRLSSIKDELGVICDQIGTPTYAPDLAEAIIDIIEKNIKGKEIYHFSNEGVCSWYDFAHEIFDLANVRIKLNAINTDEYPTPAARPKYSVLDKKKIKRNGIKVPHWRDSLKICIKELKNQQI